MTLQQAREEIHTAMHNMYGNILSKQIIEESGEWYIKILEKYVNKATQQERETWLHQKANEHDNRIREDEKNRILKLITEEIATAHKEGQSTSRLTSLYNEI